MIAEYLLGFQVIKPGFKEVELSLMQTHLSNLEAVIPSPEGELLIKWELEAEEGRLSVTIPGDIKMKLNIAEMADYSINSIYVDEKSLDKKELNQGSLLLSRGSHEISF